MGAGSLAHAFPYREMRIGGGLYSVDKNQEMLSQSEEAPVPGLPNLAFHYVPVYI